MELGRYREKGIVYCDGKEAGEVKEVGLPKIEKEQEDKVSYLQQTFDIEIVVYLCRKRDKQRKNRSEKQRVLQAS